MNNEPDYKDNLAFEPEMTWEQLVEWARDRGFEHINDFYLIKPFWSFSKTGEFEHKYNDDIWIVLSKNLKPAKMKLIIEGLM